MDNLVERHHHQGELLALVIRAGYQVEGIRFFTDANSSQQLGYMSRPAGYQVEPHWHRRVDRKIQMTQEVLFIRSGRCQLDLYGPGDVVIASTELSHGDVVLLAEGGHGLTMLEPTEIIEVKQGPYSTDEDKVRFKARRPTS